VVKRGVCRIISGRWRGRKLHFDDAEGLRPTTDRIRETVFNWLRADVPGSACLDIFAGSGALGFEAISRGAGQLLMLDNNLCTVNNLKKNREALSAANISIQKTDSLHWLQQQIETKSRSFDILFLDPPFQTPLLQQSCDLLAKSDLLRGDAKIYIEHALNDSIAVPPLWRCLKNAQAGQVAYKLFVQMSSEPA